MSWQVALGDLNGAIARLNRELPGWWWRVGSCQVSADATIAPTVESGDIVLVEFGNEFDVGFDCDLGHPATIADALNGAIDKALAERETAIKRRIRPPQRDEVDWARQRSAGTARDEPPTV